MNGALTGEALPGRAQLRPDAGLPPWAGPSWAAGLTGLRRLQRGKEEATQPRAGDRPGEGADGREVAGATASALRSPGPALSGGPAHSPAGARARAVHQPWAGRRGRATLQLGGQSPASREPWSKS